jgi:hypothetical protein
MGRNYLKGRGGGRVNAVLAAVGYNFRSSPVLAGEAFARPLPGPRRNIAECSLSLKTGAKPFFEAARRRRSDQTTKTSRQSGAQLHEHDDHRHDDRQRHHRRVRPSRCIHAVSAAVSVSRNCLEIPGRQSLTAMDRFSKPITAVQPERRELPFVPLSRHSWVAPRSIWNATASPHSVTSSAPLQHPMRHGEDRPLGDLEIDHAAQPPRRPENRPKVAIRPSRPPRAADRTEEARVALDLDMHSDWLGTLRVD